MRLKIAHKISLLSISLVMLTAGAVALLYDDGSTKLLVANALQDLSRTISDEGHQLQTHIRDLREDAAYLAQMPPVQGIVRASQHGGYDEAGSSSLQQWQQRMQSIAAAFLRSKPDYRQARLLDAGGRELVRVDSRQGEIVVVPPSGLQDKAHRPYVRETLKLGPG